jgi:hypothetical protein
MNYQTNKFNRSISENKNTVFYIVAENEVGSWSMNLKVCDNKLYFKHFEEIIPKVFSNLFRKKIHFINDIAYLYNISRRRQIICL